jgi:trigger factor
MSAEESKTFTTTLVGGERDGQEAEVTVTAHSVKVKELPELDDEFAQLASEFDTIEELRADVGQRLERQKRGQQLGQARDKALEALLDKIDMPLPDGVVENEVSRRNEQLQQQLDYAGLTKEDYLKDQEKSEEEFETEIAEAARQAVKGGFVLDQLALQEELGVENEELSEYVVTQAMQIGLQPQQLAQHLTESGQLPALVSEVLRTKSLNLLVQNVKITDESGTELDVEAIQRELSGETVQATSEEAAEAEADAPAEETPVDTPADTADAKTEDKAEDKTEA